MHKPKGAGSNDRCHKFALARAGWCRGWEKGGGRCSGVREAFLSRGWVVLEGRFGMGGTSYGNAGPILTPGLRILNMICSVAP